MIVYRVKCKDGLSHSPGDETGQPIPAMYKDHALSWIGKANQLYCEPHTLIKCDLTELGDALE